MLKPQHFWTEEVDIHAWSEPYCFEAIAFFGLRKLICTPGVSHSVLKPQHFWTQEVNMHAWSMPNCVEDKAFLDSGSKFASLE